MNVKTPVMIVFGLLLIGFTGVYAYSNPISYISLDINPSIELGISAFDAVVSAEAYNDDGEKVLENIDIKGETIENVVNQIVNSAIAEGFVKEDGTSVISITTETDNVTIVDELREAAEEGVESALTENESKAEIVEDNVALERRDEARALGITPGKLNLIQKLQAVNPEATIEDFKSSSVKDIMQATHEAKGIVQEKKEKASTGDEKKNENKTEEVLDVEEPIVENSDKVSTETKKVKVFEPVETKVIEDKNNNNASNEAKQPNKNQKKEETTQVEPEKEKNSNKGNSNKVEPEKIEPEKIEPEKIEPEKIEPVKAEPEKKTNNGKSKGN